MSELSHSRPGLGQQQTPHVRCAPKASICRAILASEEQVRGALRELLIIESEARAEASGMMVAVIVLMLVGVALSAMIWRLQAHLLRWQQHNMVE
jgi:hypothetical protein